MSDDDKVVPLRPVAVNNKKADGVDYDMLETLSDFMAVLTAHEARAFAAVGICGDGQIVNSWYTKVSPAEIIGAIEMLKSDYILRHWVEDDEQTH
jgi:hypothetical protein